MFDYQYPIDSSEAYANAFRVLRRKLETPARAVKHIFSLPGADDYVEAMVTASRQRGEATFDWLASAKVSIPNQ
ncbi:MAG: hypothetical protein ABI583_15615 [Betaproteobacteria bacterium]